MKIAIIGAGISGIAAAHTLKKCGHEIVVYEKSAEYGGVWANAYPSVALQNTENHYHLSDIPWPFEPDLHPTGTQIRDYLKHAVETSDINLQTQHEVVALDEQDAGWRVVYKNNSDNGQNNEPESITEALFDYVVVAIGQYTEGKNIPQFPGQEMYQGEVLTERDIKDLSVFKNKSTAVVGFGKSAVDMAAFAVPHAKQVHHVFRTPRWLIPFYVLGIHYAKILFCRIGTVIMPSWAYPGRFQKILHVNNSILVKPVWKLLEFVFALQIKAAGRGLGTDAKARLKKILPRHSMVSDMRSAVAMMPIPYAGHIATGKILPVQSELTGFTATGLKLNGGEHLECEQVVLCLGSQTPVFPFMPDKYRKILEKENDGVQLYRHLLHPQIPNLAFAGFNHGFMHVPAAEVAMVWLSAYLNNEIELPDDQEMESSMSRVLEWKRKHINFEPSRSCAVNTRFQQYIDIMLKDMGLSPHRKMPNIFSELFSQYGASDYSKVLYDYQQARKSSQTANKTLRVDT